MSTDINSPENINSFEETAAAPSTTAPLEDTATAITDTTDETADPSEATADSTADPTEQAKDALAKFASNLGDAPDYVLDIIQEYQRPLTVIGLVLGGLVAIKVMFAILAAINDIPVLAPTMELVGLVYTGWFIYRYLLKAHNRTELLSSLGSVKNQITGSEVSVHE